MGGRKSKLSETRWSLILEARTDDNTRRRMAIANLTMAYWKPIYCYFRRHNYANEEAKDLTQDFFHRFIVEGELFETADREIGCFRQLLSTVLKRFVINVERDKNRRKRAPKDGVIPLESVGSDSLRRSSPGGASRSRCPKDHRAARRCWRPREHARWRGAPAPAPPDRGPSP